MFYPCSSECRVSGGAAVPPLADGQRLAEGHICTRNGIYEENKEHAYLLFNEKIDNTLMTSSLWSFSRPPFSLAYWGVVITGELPTKLEVVVVTWF